MAAEVRQSIQRLTLHELEARGVVIGRELLCNDRVERSEYGDARGMLTYHGTSRLNSECEPGKTLVKRQ